MDEYRIDRVLIEVRKKGFTAIEEREHIQAYWWFGDYYAKHNPRPTTGEIGSGIGYMESKFSEAYELSKIRLQRTIDLWHEGR